MKNNPGNNRVLKQYLDLYAEKEIQDLENLPPCSFQNSLFIPAYAETTEFLQRLNGNGPTPANHSGKYLLILVSNHPQKLSEAGLHRALAHHGKINQWLGKSSWASGKLSLHHSKKFDTILVNRTGASAIPQKQGVGLARKIGADIAAALFSKGKLKRPWIMSTDADTRLPSDYFDVLIPESASALTYNFKHRLPDNPVGQATGLYESSIHHYVNGLRQAGSHYAFHTVGSAQAINLFAYAGVRGYPKRSGGEDFYLLNKLAKIGDVVQARAPIIEIDARMSDRVPFGTGPAVNRLLASPDMYAEPVFYHPEIFEYLKQVLDIFNASSLDSIQQDLPRLPGNAKKCLCELGIASALEHAQKQKLSAQTLGKHLHDWFDGFRSLRFVHLMRDQGFSNISQNELLALTADQ
ncbi:MAG: hypothetical protein RLN82_04335 [Pseudomonadales bacterium]